MSKSPILSVPSGVAFLLVLILAAPAWANVSLSFDYSLDTNGFFAEGSAARATLEAAGDFYESILEDDLAAIVPGSTYRTWKAQFNHPSTGAQCEVTNLYVPADTLIVYVGARDLGAVEDSEDVALGLAGPGGCLASGYASWIDGVKARGEGTTDGDHAQDFGPWGGSVSIDSDTKWNLDYQKSPSDGESDLYSVVLHELAHVLGFGVCDAWNNLIEEGEFIGDSSVEQYGGNIPLEETEEPAHWAEGTQNYAFPDGTPQEVLMDPSLNLGARLVPTYLDIAALDDLGWDITLPPRPEEALPGDLGGGGEGVMDNGQDLVQTCWGLGELEPVECACTGDDLAMIQTSWGQETPGVASAVPEPNVAVLLAAMGLLLFPAWRVAR